METGNLEEAMLTLGTKVTWFELRGRGENCLVLGCLVLGPVKLLWHNAMGCRGRRPSWELYHTEAVIHRMRVLGSGLINYVSLE